MVPEARGTNEASRRAENTLITLTGHTKLFLLLDNASSRRAGNDRVFLRVFFVLLVFPPSKSRALRNRRVVHVGFDDCHAFPGLGLPPLAGSPPFAGSLPLAACPSRAPCPSRAFGPSPARCPSWVPCPSLQSLSSVLKFSSLIEWFAPSSQNLKSLSSGLLLLLKI